MTKYDQKYVKQLVELLNIHPKSYALTLKSKKYEQLLSYIFEATKSFSDINLNTRIFWITHEIYDYPKCKICNVHEIPHNRKCSALNGYTSNACSQSCAQKDPEYRKTLIQRSLTKYGVECVQKTKEYKDKLHAKLKSLPKTHWENASAVRQKTCLEKYKVENVSQCKNIHDKAIESLLNKTEIEKADIVKRIKQTKFERYGNENFVNSAKIKNTVSENKLNDKDYQLKINNKRKRTCIEKYGVECTAITDAVKEKTKIARKTAFYNNKILNDALSLPLFSLNEFLYCNSKLKWKCKKCGSEFISNVYEHENCIARCLKCYPLHCNVSSYEKDIVKFINLNGIKTIESSRDIIKPQELDIYCPDKKIAFEFDGLYWHSADLGTSKYYHLHKTDECEKQGIQLIHIFENEWLYKQEIVKSRIKNLFGLYDKSVFARKCEVREVDNKTSREFQDENHIQGSVNAKVSLGLYFNDELISLMTFGKCRFDKKHEWELLRFCNKLGYHIPGAASKLLKQFERICKPISLVSYADRRWSQGKVYKTLGFKLDHISKPDYWYWNYKHFQGKLESRIKYQKHKLKSIFENFDNTKTEIENMNANGYYRIFDCGNYVFEKIYIK